MTVIFLPKADAQESRCVMIKEMVAIVKVLTDAAMSFNKFKSTTKKNNDNLELLKIYFLLKDVLEDGRKLLDVASPYSVVGSDAIDGVLNMRLRLGTLSFGGKGGGFMKYMGILASEVSCPS